MKLVIYILMFLFSLSISTAKKSIVVTGYQIKLIIKEIVQDKMEITNLVPPNSSPHTYSPRPSEIIKAKKANALIYVSDNMDSWLTKFNEKNAIELISLLPEKYIKQAETCNHDHHDHEHSHIDPHFWTDPLTVKALLPDLTKVLIKLDKSNGKLYKQNSEKFSKKLDKLNKKIVQILSQFNGEHVFLFHPSFLYFLDRYNLVYAGAIEEYPGKEPSPKYLMELIKDIKKHKAKALFTEPQLPKAPAETISKAVKLKLFVLDPIGGIDDRNSYEKLLLYNARTLKKAFSVE